MSYIFSIFFLYSFIFLDLHCKSHTEVISYILKRKEKSDLNSCVNSVCIFRGRSSNLQKTGHSVIRIVCVSLQNTTLRLEEKKIPAFMD